MKIAENEVFVTENGDVELKKRVVPESSLEEEVLRQAILADNWKILSDSTISFGSNTIRLLSHGGQAIYQSSFSSDLIVFYQIGEYKKNGFYDLSVKLIHKENNEEYGNFDLSACLAITNKPPFQTGWNGTFREHFVCPWYYFFGEQLNSKGISFKNRVQDFDNAPLVLSPQSKTAPHILLIDADSIKK